MQIQSPGYLSECLFIRFSGQVIDRADCVVFETPSNPRYYWGNALIFPAPPGPDDFDRWRARFRLEFQHAPAVKHEAYGWSGEPPTPEALKPFEDAGFELEEHAVLTTSSVNPPRRVNQQVEIRALTSDADWQKATALQIECRDDGFALETYTPFKTQQMLEYRRMSEAGLGAWFGAFLGERLVADLGIFAEAGVGRFQTVETHPDFRQQGICGTLVYRASRYALETLGAQTLVMVADEHYHAARIYESVGFQATAREGGLMKRP